MDANRKRTRSNSASNERTTKKTKKNKKNKKDFVLRVILYNRRKRGELASLIKIRINPAKKLKTLFKLINDQIATDRIELLQLTVDRADHAISPSSNMSIDSYGITNKTYLVGTVIEVVKKNGFDFGDALKSSGSASSSDYSFSDWEHSLSKDKHN